MAKVSIEIDMVIDGFIEKADCFIEKIKQMTEAVRFLNKNCKMAEISLKALEDVEAE